MTIARASRDGAVAVHERFASAEVSLDSLMRNRVNPALRLADELVTDLGGSGDIYVTVFFNGGRPPRPAEAPERVALHRGPLSTGIDTAQVASLIRELERAFRGSTPEP
jgi:hypothetical protein